MNTKSIVQLIGFLSNIKQLDFYKKNKLNLDSIEKKSRCNLCQIFQQNLGQITQYATSTTDQFNRLLKQVQILIDMYYQLFEQQQTKFEQTAIELQKENRECEQRIKQLQQIIEQNSKTILQYRNLLLEKDEILVQYQQKYQKYFRQRSIGSPTQQIQILKFHKRQKSQMCNHLQNLNLDLLSDNKKFKQQNKQLIEHVNQLNEYVKRMEQDLANNNIKSPRILNEFTQFPEFSNGFDKTLEQFDRSSIQQQNQSHSRLQIQQTFYQRNSLRSSFAPNGRPLRDVLNISGQTSNYFNLRTKEKFQSSNQNTFKINKENFNSANILKQQKSTSLNKIMEIKQFQINQSSNLVNNKKENIQKLDKKKQLNQSRKNTENKSSICMQLDPYYAFFTLTIQCLKLNWKCLDQVANIQLNGQWDKILKQQIPINKWNDYLKQIMVLKVSTYKE